MNSDEVFAAIEEIAATPSKTEKERLVKKHLADSDFTAVIQHALDPYVTYGIAKMPEVVKTGDDAQWDTGTWQLLAGLANRNLTGNAAREKLIEELADLSDDSAELLRRVIRKDLRAGFGDSTVNKAKKGFIPTFPYMRCSLPSHVDLNTWDWAGGVVSQEKADGMFANVNREGDIVTVTSRQGSPFPLDHLDSFVAEAIARLPDNTQTHGEFLVKKGGIVLERALSNGVMNSILNGGEFEADEELVYLVWDQIPLSAVTPKGRLDVPYHERLKNIVAALSAVAGNHIGLIPTRIVRTQKDAYAHYFSLLAQNKEGTIIKRRDGTWRDGTSKDQVKLKLEVDVDLVIVGINEGREGTKNEGRAGAFACETSCGALKVDVAVKNEAMRDAVDANNDDWIGRVIVVRSNQIVEPSESNEFHSLFLPRMVETHYRTDKTEADSLQQVRDQFESAVRGESKAA